MGDFGRPVLLLHGLTFDRTMWWPLAAELTRGCTVVAPDLPGHGDSPARDEISIAGLIRDLATLLNRLDLHRAPIVVGHASAARLATAFAETYATHHVQTVDEMVGEVPEYFRPYTEPRHDKALLTAYASWPWEAEAVFPHLADPAGFAGDIQALLP
ncbi:alpha/beta fold hydrolase [Paractinoplanes durhamensis]|uniref:alpha/beta fold hydrolase n=1 Tax=Paractinoplanes durhamensis TaxID=113563 RepID=UPI0036428DAC